MRKLRRARRSLRSLDWDDVKFAELSSELRLAYKRARGAMGEARKTGSDEDFHTWRKQIKALRPAARAACREAERVVDMALTSVRTANDTLQASTRLESCTAAHSESHHLLVVAVRLRKRVSGLTGRHLQAERDVQPVEGVVAVNLELMPPIQRQRPFAELAEEPHVAAESELRYADRGVARIVAEGSRRATIPGPTGRFVTVRALERAPPP